MHRRRGMANQGFRSAQTDRQFEYLKAIEESERVRLISFDVEGECRAGRSGLPLHQLLRGVVGGKQRRIMDARHLGVTSEEARHGSGIAGRSPHPKRKRLQRARQHPARMRVELRADGAARPASRRARAPPTSLIGRSGLEAQPLFSPAGSSTTAATERARRIRTSKARATAIMSRMRCCRIARRKQGASPACLPPRSKASCVMACAGILDQGPKQGLRPLLRTAT